MTHALHHGFLRSAGRFPNRPAAALQDATISYGDLKSKAASLAATLRKHAGDEPPLTAVFAYRSVTAFTGVLGALFRGHGYVPLSRLFPPERTRAMLRRSGCRAVIVDAASEKKLEHVLEGIEADRVLILPDREDVSEIARQFPRHKVLGARDLEPPEAWEPVDVSEDSIAYLLFTSGSTGTPKGVMVAHRNVRAFIGYMAERYAITENDRLSGTFALTFDLSVFDMFMAWERGACVCCPSQKALIKPGKYIRESDLTVWFSVPSTALFMKKLGELKEARYPGLRLSLFCGEALPKEVVEDWASAAPNAMIENLYGPTELTISCTLYQWDPVKSPAQCEHGIVPIGEPYPSMTAIVVDDGLCEVGPGEEGELLMTGPQLCLGYFEDAGKTAAAFVIPPGKTETYYRTGDRVRRASAANPMTYLGRLDNQIQIHGYRVELGEVEAVIREVAGAGTAIAVGWPVTASGPSGIVAFLDDKTVDIDALRARAKTRLPDYMMPWQFNVIERFPLNPNGKVDRKALLRILETTP